MIAYLTGNFKAAEYLRIVNVKGTGELTVFCGALVGAALGFLWFNSYPAQVFMGDVGSLALGGAIGTLAVLTKAELLLPLIGGIYVVEAGSVIIQVVVLQVLRAARLPHGAAAPSLRDEGLGRAEDHRALLDPVLHAGAPRPHHAQAAIERCERNSSAGRGGRDAARDRGFFGLPSRSQRPRGPSHQARRPPT